MMPKSNVLLKFIYCRQYHSIVSPAAATGRSFPSIVPRRHRLQKKYIPLPVHHVPPEKYEKAVYPLIKPRWPPCLPDSGLSWSKATMNELGAWELHEKSEELRKLPKLKQRLELLAHPKVRIQPSRWTMYRPFEDWESLSLVPNRSYPARYNVQKYLMKTTILDNFPQNFSFKFLRQSKDEDKENLHEHCLDDNLTHKIDYENVVKNVMKKLEFVTAGARSHAVYREIIYAVQSQLPQFINHSVAEDVPLSAGVYRYLKESYDNDADDDDDDDDDKRKKFKGVLYEPNYSMLRCHAKSTSNFQVRTEYPLPPRNALDDPLCRGSSEVIDTANPDFFDMPWEFAKPKQMSGHWMGDPCEFVQTSFYETQTEFEELKQNFESDIVEKELANAAMVNGFTVCVAQAHYQGFNYYDDLTYPVSTQVVVSDGSQVQLMIYQLNTLQLWKHDNDNPRINLAWKLPPVRLFEKDSVNEAAVRYILEFLSQSCPCPSYDLRPFLPAQPSPLATEHKINSLGEERILQKEVTEKFRTESVYYISQALYDE